MRKISFVILVVLLLMGAVSVTKAQGDTPNSVKAGDGPTSEFFQYGSIPVSEGDCFKISYTVFVKPDVFRLSVENRDANGRSSYDLEAYVGDHDGCIPLATFGWDNPDGGFPDLTKPFDVGAAGTISGFGVHVWDDAKDADLVVHSFSIVHKTLPVLTATPSADSNLHWCPSTEKVITAIGNGYLYVTFSHHDELTSKNSVVLFIDGKTVIEIDPVWDGFNRMRITEKFGNSHLNAIYPRVWNLQYLGKC